MSGTRGAPIVAAVFAVALLGARGARAEPQWNGALLGGATGVGDDGGWWRRTTTYAGLRGEVLFGRGRNVEMGAGPYVSVGTVGWEDVRPGAGGSWLVPLNEYVPVVLSGGGYASFGRARPGAGVSGSLFIGAHSHNFHSAYAMVWGVALGVERSVIGAEERIVTVAAHLDLVGLALPGLLLYEAVKGPPPTE
ncbi:MAG: hypothetical protein IT376_23150 [Polyangiaceae bacterium]|nr:hypothetical protein [Polyangiaceae bacterium]